VANTAAVTKAVAGADVVVAFVGLHPSSGAPGYPGYGTVCAESEAQDRLNITLCGQQQAVRALAASSALDWEASFFSCTFHGRRLVLELARCCVPS
jgi:nicotinamide mononucleotide (NMN) deamidase PncC